MTKAIYFILLMLPMALHGQDKTIVYHTYSHTGKIEFERVASWCAQTFSNTYSDVLVSDKQSGLIMYKSAFDYRNSNAFFEIYTGPVSYSVKVEVLEDKTVLTFSHFKHQSEQARAAIGLLKTSFEPDAHPLGSKKVHTDLLIKCGQLSQELNEDFIHNCFTSVSQN